MKKAVIDYILILFVYCFSAVVIYAVPAYPKPVTINQPDGSRIEVTIKGDERIKWAVTSDGYTVLFNKNGCFEYAELNSGGDMVLSGIVAKEPGKRSKKDNAFLSGIKKELIFNPAQISFQKTHWEVSNKVAEKAFPTTGSQKLICILIGFTDQTFSKTQSDFYDLFNQTNYMVDGATGSVNDYYTEVSYSQLDLSVDVAGPYIASHEMAYYGENTATGYDINPRSLITEAITIADEDIDFADYDNDHDGYVDGVYVIYAGYGEEAGATDDAIWAHAWSISPVTLDGVTISRYSCSAELRGNTGYGLTRIGVICHEFGHVLGAPDFYDTDYSGSGGYFKGTGAWDIMASGSWNNNGATPAHHNAFTKTYIYNWASAIQLNSETTVEVHSAAFHPEDFYQYNTNTPDEFYLIENRTRDGFDSDIPGEGLIVYHVHSDVLSVGNKINTGHPQKMYPVCANSATTPDALPSSYGNINSSGCPFPGTGNVSFFTDMNLPSSRSWNGEDTNQPLTNIVFHDNDKTVIFDFMGGDSGNQGEDCSDAVWLAGECGSKNVSTTDFRNDYTGNCVSEGADRVYYLSNPIQDGGIVEISAEHCDYDMVLYARYGSCTGVEIGCINDPQNETLIWQNTTGSDQNIWFFVDGDSNSNGNSTIHWQIIQPVAAGEDCADPFRLSGISGEVAFNTTGYSDDFTSESSNGASKDIVFYLETPVPPGGTIDFWTSDDNYDVVLYGRYGDCTGIEIAFVDDPDGKVLSWINQTGTEQNVYIIADGYGQSEGNGILNWVISKPGNPGENCDNPIIITGNSGSIEFSTAGYADDYTGSCESTGGDIVYFLDTPVPDGQTLELWTSGENYNVSIYGKYESCDGPEIGCFNEKSGSGLSWSNTTGDNQGVWIVADGFSGSEGEAVLHWNIVETVTAIDGIAFDNKVSVYPNPASDKIRFTISEGDLIVEKITVYNIMGSVVSEFEICNPYLSMFEIDVSGYFIGTYILEIHLNNGVMRKKIQIVR